MASLRKKYSMGVSVERPEAPAVAATPVTAASPPPAAEAQKPLEEIAPEKPSPVEEAGAAALKQRLQEMINAEGLQREFQQGQHRLAAEPPQQPQQAMPAHVKEWLTKHPQYLNDAVAQAELNLATMKCVRDGLTWNDDN